MEFALAFASPNVISRLLGYLFGQRAIDYVIWPLVQIVIVITAVAFWALYATYLERKVSAFMQARLGPMRVGKWGLAQPFADALKLLTKEDTVPGASDPYLFKFAPFISVAAAFLVFAVIPFGPDWAVITDVNIGILFILAVSSIGVLALILAGWASNSKYALLGGLRSSAQMVSYEVAMGLSIVGALMFTHTLSMSGMVMAQARDSIWFVLYQPLALFIFLISGIAENNRAPFDLPEAESELVAGFHTEYSGMRWSLFFMAEYAAMVVIAAVATTLYLGGWYFPGIYWLTEARGHHNLYVLASIIVFVAKLSVLLYLYFWLRWTFPRYRYDQLMDLGWKWTIPAALANIILTALSVFIIQWLNVSGVHTIESTARGLNLTGLGKALMVMFGFTSLFITAVFLFYVNRRSRDFNLKTQRRNIRLVNVPKGRPAVPQPATGNEPAAVEG
jgi:NADH-quinone oxidoreductase subunit H